MNNDVFRYHFSVDGSRVYVYNLLNVFSNLMEMIDIIAFTPTPSTYNHRTFWSFKKERYIHNCSFYYSVHSNQLSLLYLLHDSAKMLPGEFFTDMNHVPRKFSPYCVLTSSPQRTFFKMAIQRDIL